MVDTGEIWRNSVALQHKDRANFLAGLFSHMVIRPYFQSGVPITWYLDEVGMIKNGDEWKIPEIAGTSPMEVIDKAYQVYVIEQPIIQSKDGPFQVTDDRTITFGQEPYQRPFKT